jgi:two-component sensor histidine kinase
MALVHETLYQSGNLSEIDFADYVNKLSASLFRAYRVNPAAVDVRVDADAYALEVDRAVSLGLIVNELVSNALKHAFPGDRQGCVIVSLKTRGDEGDVALTVSDDGIGFPEDVDYRMTPTLGMQLVVTLVDQVGGTVTLDRSNGTTFTITLGSKGTPGGST